MWFNFKKYPNDTLGGILINLAIAFAFLLTLVILYFFVYLPYATNHGETITVPNIEGRTIEELESVLGQRHLRWEINDSSYSEKYPPFTVLKQFPHPGAKVKENRKIFISINQKDPPTVPIPNLIDGSVVNAEALLKANELKRGSIELVPGPFNTVKAMKYQGKILTPKSKVPKGATIDLIVMDGDSRDFDTPDLTGMSLDEAKALILGSDLNMGSISLVGDASEEDGIVVKQNPMPNENIKVGDVVDLWIGRPEDQLPEEEGDENQ